MFMPLNSYDGTKCESLDRAKYYISSFGEYRNNNEIIPNNSFAGAKRKSNFNKMKVLNIKDFGAVGDGANDDSAAFKNILERSKSFQNVKIEIPQGRYKISQQIKVPRSNILIQGDGAGRTVLLMTRPLALLYPKDLFLDKKNSFSWKGGLFDIGPDVILAANYAWGVTSSSNVGVSPASRGDESIGIEKFEKFREGELIWIEYLDNKKHDLLNYIAGYRPNQFDWEKNGKVWLWRRLLWPVKVKEQRGLKLILEQPLRLDIREPWQAVVHLNLEYVHDVEIRGLSIEMVHPIKKEHLKELGYNGVYIHRSVDVLVDDVIIKNADNGFLLESVKNVTLSNVSAEGRLRYHHPFFTKDAHDVLIEKFKILSPSIHGMNSDRFGSGNVWRDGYLSHGTFDAHHGMQFDLIRTKIEMNIDGQAGGDASDGPNYGKRVVNWNILYSGHNDQDIFKDSINVAVEKEPSCREPFLKSGISDLLCLIQDKRCQ